MCKKEIEDENENVPIYIRNTADAFYERGSAEWHYTIINLARFYKLLKSQAENNRLEDQLK